MKGKFFGYNETEPCQHCGAPRVIEDWDDDAYVSPGILHPKIPAKCEITRLYWDRKGNGELYWEAPQMPWDERVLKDPDVCPLCGGKIIENEEIVRIHGTYGRSHTEERIIRRCENSLPTPAWVEKVEGCPKCCESSHWG